MPRNAKDMKLNTYNSTNRVDHSSQKVSIQKTNKQSSLPMYIIYIGNSIKMVVNVVSFSKYGTRRVLFSMQQQISNALFDV